MRILLTITAALVLAAGTLAQPRTAAATGADELGCRLAHAEVQRQLNGIARCVKTTHETARPSCQSPYTYSVRSGEDKCVRLPENFPPPGSLIAIPTEPVACPPAAGNGPWQLVRDANGIQDQCERTRTEVVPPGRLTLPGAQQIPSPLVKK